MSFNNIYLPVPVVMNDWRPWCEAMARSVNNLIIGKANTNTITLSLSTGTTSTTVTDSRIGGLSAILLVPQTAHAAAELAGGTIYIPAATQTEGTAVIQHSNSANADRTYRVLIFG